MLRQLAAVVVIIALTTIIVGIIGAVFQPRLAFGGGSMGSGVSLSNILAMTVNNTHLVVIGQPSPKLVSYALSSGMTGPLASSPKDIDVITSIRVKLDIRFLPKGSKLFFGDYAVSKSVFTKLARKLYGYTTVSSSELIPYDQLENAVKEIEKESIVSIKLVCNATGSCSVPKPVEISLSEVMKTTGGKIEEVTVIALPLDIDVSGITPLVFRTNPPMQKMTLRELIDYVRQNPGAVYYSTRPLSFAVGTVIQNTIMAVDVMYAKSYVLLPSPRLAARMGFLGVAALVVWIAVCKYMEEPCRPQLSLGPLGRLGKIFGKKSTGSSSSP